MKQLRLFLFISAAWLFGGVSVALASNLPSCPSDPSAYWTDCFGTTTFANGDEYTGEFSDNKFNGRGTYSFTSGEKYVGEFKDGKRHGRGTTTFIDGDKHVGEYEHSKFHGLGTYSFASGDSYAGEFKEGKRHGQGVYSFGPNSEWAGAKYVGEYKNGKPDGMGSYTYANGDLYIGEFKDGDKHGQGTYSFGPNSEWAGDRYAGGYKNDKYAGRGTYFWSDGNRDVGTFADGKLNGFATRYDATGTVIKQGIWKDDLFQYAQEASPALSRLPDCPSSKSAYWNNCFGTHSFANGEKYVGEFRDNNYHGQGTYSFPNGDRHTGGYKNGKYDGQGTYIFGLNSKWAGDQYVGEYSGGLQHGQGTYTFANGAKYVGEYQNGKRHGEGVNFFASGEKYVGAFKNGERHGQGVSTFSNGDKHVGDYKSGKYDGLGSYTFAADGEKYVGEYKNGKSDGQGTYTFANGSKYSGGYKQGRKHGQGTYFWADGDKDVGTFKNGKLNGYAVRYDASGTIIKQGIWKDDQFQYAQASPPNSNSSLPACPDNSKTSNWNDCVGTYTDDRGNQYVGEHKNGLADGQGTLIFASGNKYVGEFKSDRRHGQGTYYYTNGDKYVGSYVNDKRHGQGTYYYSNGDRYVGAFEDGQQNGKGTYSYADGSKVVGEFKDDKLDGYAVSYDTNGSILRQGIWKDDKFQYAENSPPVVSDSAGAGQSADYDQLISASSGSGFSVSENGYIMTNQHVIDGCQELFVHSSGNKYPATVITFDTRNDLALLKTDLQPSTVFPLAEDRPELLQDIYVAGYPFGMNISSSVKVTKGIISSLTGIGNNFSEIQIDAALQSGNSGGPILDANGNVVGVAVAKLDVKYALENFGAIPEDTNFGIKANVVESILDSNNVTRPVANKTPISKSELGRRIMDGTFYISCWMTLAQIENLKTKKVMFEDLK